MALGFDYTLSPDEQSSWKSFEEFAKKVSDKGINVPLTFGGGSGGSNPGSQPKLALEKQIKEIQNQLNKTLDGLSIKSAKLDLNDIIPIQELQEKIGALGSIDIPLTDLRHESKLIKQEIQEWSTLANNFGDTLKKVGIVSEGLRDKIDTVTSGDKLEQQQNNIVASTEKTALKVKLIQENLFNQLNKLTLKTDGNLLDGLIPVETLTKQINSLGQAGESTQSLNLRVKELRTELQQYGIVQNNIEAIMEDMIQNNGKLSDSFKLQGDIINKVTDAYENYADVKKNADNAQKEVQDKIQLIKTSKEYQSATEREKLRIDELCDSLKILAFSEKSVDDQKKDFIQTLDREKDLLDARYIDEARRKYDDLEGTIKNLVVRYVSLQAILHNVKAYYQDVIQYTKDLDDAYTDVAISMDITREEFNAWTKDARVIAQANGQTTTSLMEMVKIYAQAGEDITAVQDKLAGTAMIQNITQWDAEQTTAAVNSIIAQYKLMDTEINGVTGDVANAIQYLGDNLIAISNELSIDNVAGIQEMVSAIDDAGSVVRNAGGSMEWYMGVTGALAESMNATGSEVGSALRMISARTLQQKQAFMELNDEGEDVEIAMANAEKALKQIGVSIRDDMSGELRGLEDILGDVAEKWQYLDDSTKQFVGEKLAGNNRRSYFESLMDNYQRVEDLAKAGENSFGELAEANQKRVESFEGQLNILKDKMLAFTDSLQPLIFGSVELGNNLLDLVNFIGAIPTVVGLASASFLSFSDSGQKVKNTLMEMVGSKIQLVDGFNQIISAQNQRVESAKNEVAIAKQQISSTIETIAKLRLEHSARNDNTEAIVKQQQALVGLNKGLVNSQKQLAIATLKATAFQAALSLGLSVAIGGAIALIGAFVKELKNATPSLESVQDSVQNFSQSISDYEGSIQKAKQAKEDISSVKGIINQLDNENLSFEKQNELLEEANSLLASHGSNYTSIKSTLENENIPLEERVKLLEREAELETERNAREAYKNVTQADFFGNSLFDQLGNSLDKDMGEYATLVRQMNSQINSLFGSDDLIQKKTEEISNKYNALLKESITDMEGFVTQANEGYSSVMKAYDLGIISEEEFNKYKQQYEDLINNLEEWASQNKVAINIATLSVDSESKETVDSKAEEVVKGIKEKIANLSKSIEDEVNIEIQAKSYDNLTGSLGELKEGSEEAKQVLSTLKDTFEDMPDDVDTLAEAIDYLNGKLKDSEVKALNEDYLSALESIKEAKDLLDSFDEGLDVSEMRSLFDSELLADYNGALTDTVAIQDHLKNKIGEMEAQGLLAYANLKGENESFWTSANANSEDYFNNTIKNTSLWENFTKQVNENLALIHSTMVNSMGDKYEDYFNDAKTAYGVDLSNCKTAAESRIKIEAEAAEKIAQMRKAISQASYDYGTVTMPDGTQVNYGEYHETPDTSKFNEAIAQIQAWKNQAIGALSQVGQFQDVVFNSTTTKPSGSSSSGNKGSSSSSSKEVADLDLKIDRYYDLQDAIDDVNNALDKNQVLQERATGVEKAKLMKEEIKLYQDLQKATQDLVKEQQKERDELKKTISSYGGTFDSNGDIKNRKKWLEGLQAQVNKLSGESKEAKKEEIETLMAIIERYEELHNDTIPSTQLEYENLTNTIKDLQKEQLEYITDLQKDITSAIESELKKRTEAIKSELEKQKELYNSQYDEETWERELATEQRKLDEIQQQIDNAMRDTSLAGQLYLQQLREEYAEQEKAINEMIRDKEHELGENRFDEEIEKIEKEEEAMLDPENIADLVNKAIANGFVTIGNETIQLNQLMSDWLDDTGDGLYAVGNLLKSEMIDNLKTVKSLMQDVGLVSLSGGVAVSSASYVPTANTRAIDNAISNNTNNNSNVSIGSLLTVQGNVTEDVMPQLQGMISQSEKRVLNMITDALKFK